MRWKIENEELLFLLYFEVKTRYENKNAEGCEALQMDSRKITG